MGDITRTLAANSGQDVAAAGNYIFLKTASAGVRVVLKEQSVHMAAGDRWDVPDGFKSFRIENETGSAISCEFVVDRGGYFRSTVSGAVAISQGATLAQINATAGAAAASIAAANATRRSITIQNIDAANTARIGNSGVSALTGLRLRPGEAFTANAAAAAQWFAIREGAANAALIVFEERD